MPSQFLLLPYPPGLGYQFYRYAVIYSLLRRTTVTHEHIAPCLMCSALEALAGSVQRSIEEGVMKKKNLGLKHASACSSRSSRHVTPSSGVHCTFESYPHGKPIAARTDTSSLILVIVTIATCCSPPAVPTVYTAKRWAVLTITVRGEGWEACCCCHAQCLRFSLDRNRSASDLTP